MRKMFSALFMLIIAMALTSSAFASTVPDKILKTKMVTADEVLTTGGGWLVYSFKVYANGGANAVASLADSATLAGATTALTKAENGEATQYKISDTGDFLYPIEFTTGVTCIVDANAYALIQYED